MTTSAKSALLGIAIGVVLGFAGAGFMILIDVLWTMTKHSIG